MQIITLPRQSTPGQHIKKLSGKLGKELLTMAPSNPKFAQPSDLRRQALYMDHLSSKTRTIIIIDKALLHLYG